MSVMRDILLGYGFVVPPITATAVQRMVSLLKFTPAILKSWEEQWQEKGRLCFYRKPEEQNLFSNLPYAVEVVQPEMFPLPKHFVSPQNGPRHLMREILVGYRVLTPNVTPDQVEQLIQEARTPKSWRDIWENSWLQSRRLPSSRRVNSFHFQNLRYWRDVVFPEMFPCLPPLESDLAVAPSPKIAEEKGVKGTESPAESPKPSEGSVLAQLQAETKGVVGPSTETNSDFPKLIAPIRFLREETPRRAKHLRIRLRLDSAAALEALRPKIREEAVAMILEAHWAEIPLEPLIAARNEIHQAGVKLNAALKGWYEDQSDECHRNLLTSLLDLVVLFDRLIGKALLPPSGIRLLEGKSRGTTKQLRVRILPGVVAALEVFRPETWGEAVAMVLETHLEKIDLGELLTTRSAIQRIEVNLNQVLRLKYEKNVAEEDRHLLVALTDLVQLFQKLLGRRA